MEGEGERKIGRNGRNEGRIGVRNGGKLEEEEMKKEVGMERQEGRKGRERRNRIEQNWEVKKDRGERGEEGRRKGREVIEEVSAGVEGRE